MAIRLEPLEDPDFFPFDARASLEWMKQVCFNVSGGKLNDFSEHSPIVAILEAELAGIKDLDVRCQQLPRAMSIAILKGRGIQRILGRAATVELTFFITSRPFGSFRISKGYKAKSRVTGILYQTDADLSISAGGTQGRVTATPVIFQGGRYVPLIGLSGNAQPRTIELLTDRLAGLLGVTNEEEAKGGVPAETLGQTLARGFAAMRRPPNNDGEYALTSRDDYEQAAVDYLGVGSVAIAVGRLSQNRNIVNGAVHVFCLNPDLTPLSTVQIVNLRADLARQSQIGLGELVSVSSVELFRLTVRATISFVNSNPDLLGDRINAMLTEYLRPGNLPLGDTLIVNSLEAEIYNTLPSGSAVYSIILIVADENFENEKVHYTNVGLPQKWQTFLYSGIDLTFVDSLSGEEFFYLTGEGGDRD